jgi:tRNA dimethylallyltransferase
MNPSISSKPKIVLISGSTGSGKSSLANAMFFDQRIPPFEIISADSRQIYKEMDIGTDKPDRKILSQIPYHMIDIIYPDQVYSAADFCRRTRRIIADLQSNQIIPLIVGGTGLYIRALIYGLAPVRGETAAIRRRLKEELQQKGVKFLYQRLVEQDSERAAHIHPGDAYRIIRALEILENGTRRISETFNLHGFNNPEYTVLFLLLTVNREILYNIIDARVDRMVNSGLIEEVEGLVRKYGKSCQALTGIGYRQIVSFLNKEISRDESIRLIKRDTRHFVKRQMTWFKKEKNVTWIDHDPDSPDKTLNHVVQLVKEFLSCDAIH